MLWLLHKAIKREDKCFKCYENIVTMLLSNALDLDEETSVRVSLFSLCLGDFFSFLFLVETGDIGGR